MRRGMGKVPDVEYDPYMEYRCFGETKCDSKVINCRVDTWMKRLRPIRSDWSLQVCLFLFAPDAVIFHKEEHF
jgi:hypothetical protein